MPHRPHRSTRRHPRAARGRWLTAPSLAIGTLALGACGARSLVPGSVARLSPQEQRGVLACAAEVGAEQGLAVLPAAAGDSGEAMLRLAPGDAGSDPAAVQAALAGTGPTRDELLVGFGAASAAPTGGRLRHALRVAVRSFRLTAEREGRGDAPSGAARTEWRPTPVSLHGAELRDLVLTRCGTLGR